jgi:hypothetical protein
MKHSLKYPRTTSELKNLINFLDFTSREIEEDLNTKSHSRSWLQLCHQVNLVKKEARSKVDQAKLLNKEAKQNLNPVSYLSTTCDVNFHDKVLNTLEKWMRSKGIPIW